MLLFGYTVVLIYFPFMLQNQCLNYILFQKYTIEGHENNYFHSTLSFSSITSLVWIGQLLFIYYIREV